MGDLLGDVPQLCAYLLETKENWSKEREKVSHLLDMERKYQDTIENLKQENTKLEELMGQSFMAMRRERDRWERMWTVTKGELKEAEETKDQLKQENRKLSDTVKTIQSDDKKCQRREHTEQYVYADNRSEVFTESGSFVLMSTIRRVEYLLSTNTRFCLKEVVDYVSGKDWLIMACVDCLKGWGMIREADQSMGRWKVGQMNRTFVKVV